MYDMNTSERAAMFVYSVVSRMHSDEGHNSHYYHGTELLARCVGVVDWEWLANAREMKWTTNREFANALQVFAREKMVGVSGGAALIAAAATVDTAVAEVPGVFGEWVAHELVDDALMERMQRAMQCRKPLEWDSMRDMVHEIEDGKWTHTGCLANQRRLNCFETGGGGDDAAQTLAQKLDLAKLRQRIERYMEHAVATEEKIAKMFRLLGNDVVYEYEKEMRDVRERDHDIKTACGNLYAHLLDANSKNWKGFSNAAREAWEALHKQPDGLLEQLHRSVSGLTAMLPLYLAVLWRDLQNAVLKAAQQVTRNNRTETRCSVQAVCDAERALTVVDAVAKMVGLAGADVRVVDGVGLRVRCVYLALRVALHTVGTIHQLPSSRTVGN